MQVIYRIALSIFFGCFISYVISAQENSAINQESKKIKDLVSLRITISHHSSLIIYVDSLRFDSSDFTTQVFLGKHRIKIWTPTRIFIPDYALEK